MNITDQDGLWRITDDYIEDRKTGQLRMLEVRPSANEIAQMPYRRYLRKCRIAFTTGRWPA